MTTTTPSITINRQILELRVDVDPPLELTAGKYRMTVHSMMIIYRTYVGESPWEFIHVIVHGTWINGAQSGKIAHRKYGRATQDRLPQWLRDFISGNVPESENKDHG